MPVSLSRIWC